MATTLRNRLDELASNFASGVLEAIRSASIDDLVAESSTSSRPRAPSAAARPARAARRAAPRTASRGKRAAVAKPASKPAPAPARATPAASAPRAARRGRLARRSASDITTVIQRIAGLLKGSKGLRAEEIRQQLGLAPKEMPRPLKEGLSSGRLGKSGHKRATTYFLKGGAGSVATPAPATTTAAAPAPAAPAKSVKATKTAGRKSSASKAGPKPPKADRKRKRKPVAKK